MTKRAVTLLERIAKEAEKIQQDTRAQEERIVEAHREGASLRDIAAAAGLSHMSVKRIIQRNEEQ